MKKHLLCLALATVTSLPFAAHSADVQRQAEVAKLGPDVMPFSLKATTHVFTKSSDGGTQRVIAKDGSDAVQTRLVRGTCWRLFANAATPRNDYKKGRNTKKPIFTISPHPAFAQSQTIHCEKEGMS